MRISDWSSDVCSSDLAKQRRAGVVVDEDWQARWYLDRLPADVHNAQALDAWYARLPKEKKQGLEWSRADLIAGDETDVAQFPPYIALGDARQIGRASCRERVCQYV